MDLKEKFPLGSRVRIYAKGVIVDDAPWVTKDLIGEVIGILENNEVMVRFTHKDGCTTADWPFDGDDVIRTYEID